MKGNEKLASHIWFVCQFMAPDFWLVCVINLTSQ